VNFIKHYTAPNVDAGELHKVTETPLVTIHLSIKKKDKKVRLEGQEVDTDNMNRVVFKPSLDECRDFVLNGVDMIIQSTNNMSKLESDLVPFLQKEATPSFQIGQSHPLILDANEKLDATMAETFAGPEALIEKFQKYDYILNINKKALIDDLFKGEENG